MKKSIIFFITIALLSFFATSCCEKKTIKVKDKDKLRFNENDMFIYKSNLGNYDTLFFKEIKSEFLDAGTSGEYFCPERKVYVELVYYYYDNYTDPFPDDSLLYLELYPNQQSIYLYAPNPLGEKPLDIYFIGDSIYEDVEFARKPLKTSVNGAYMFFYNKKYGLLSYKFRTGEEYALQKYIPNK